MDSIFDKIPEVKKGKMFGYPGYYIGGKLFACIFENGLGLKVPEELAIKLRERDYIDFFQPLGRKKMKEWIQINREKSEDFERDRDIKCLSELCGFYSRSNCGKKILSKVKSFTFNELV